MSFFCDYNYYISDIKKNIKDFINHPNFDN